MTREQIEEIAQKNDAYEFVTNGQLNQAVEFAIEISSIQQEEFRQQLDMWLSPENSKYYWEIVKIIESLNTK